MNQPHQNPPNLDSKIQNIKIIILGFFSILLFYISLWYANLAIHETNPLWFWLIPISITSLAISALTFFTLTNSQSKWFWLINSIILIGYVVIFPKDIFVFLGGIGFFVLSFWFERRIRAEEISRADFSMRRVMSDGLNLIIYGLLLVLAFNLYYSTSQEFKSNPEGFYRKIGESAAVNVDKLNFEQSFKQYLVETSASEEEFRQILSTALAQRMRETVKPYERFFPLIFTLAFIGLLRTFSFLYRWWTLLVTWIVFRILLAFKFFKIEKVPVEVNKLVI